MAVSSQVETVLADLFRLDDKVALVTGASRGLGRGMALALATAGANVAVHASELPPDGVAEEIQQITGRRARVLTADLMDRAATDRVAGSADHSRQVLHGW